jgi:hypothetical protein
MYPVIRLNALPIAAAPLVCRLVDCGVGGTAQVREAVHAAAADLIVGRRKLGVLAFGADAEVHRVFDRFGVQRFDLHEISLRRLRYESTELGMLTEALARALMRERPVRAVRRRQRYLLTIDPQRRDDPHVRQLASAAGGRLDGVVLNSDGRQWVEALAIRLDQRLGQLWLLIEPTVWVERASGEPMPDVCKEFVRERLAGRYNANVNALMNAWIAVITAGDDATTVSAFGEVEGVNAAFTIRGSTGFSRRAHGRPQSASAAVADATASIVARPARARVAPPGRRNPRGGR